MILQFYNCLFNINCGQVQLAAVTINLSLVSPILRTKCCIAPRLISGLTDEQN